MVMSRNKPEEDKDSDDESLEGVAVGSTGLYPCATGRESSDLQDSTRSGIVLNVEHLSEIANPSLVGRVDEQCLQIREDGEIRTDSVSEEEQMSVPILSQISQNFNWENFCYAFFFGLLPTAWDIWTDIQFGVSQEGQGEETTAGFCYMFICLPAILSIIPAVVSRVYKEWGKVAESTLMAALYILFVCLVSVTVSSAMAFAFVMQPTVFKYPALLCSLFTLGVKILAVFLHTPEMIEFSLNASSAESSYESSTQLLFLLHIWLSGGHMYLSAMVSSILVIGKVGAENILMKGQENKMKDKSFLEKVVLLLRYTPVIALTALFRVGSASTVLYHPHLFPSFVTLTPAFAMFLTWIYLMCNITLLITLLGILRTWIRKLRQLTIVELSLGLLNECTTVTVWGKLGREGSKGLLLASTTYHFLLNCSYLSWQMATANTIEQATGVNPYTKPFFTVCHLVLACGPISYLLAVYQLLLMDI